MVMPSGFSSTYTQGNEAQHHQQEYIFVHLTIRQKNNGEVKEKRWQKVFFSEVFAQGKVTPPIFYSRERKRSRIHAPAIGLAKKGDGVVGGESSKMERVYIVGGEEKTKKKKREHHDLTRWPCYLSRVNSRESVRVRVVSGSHWSR